MTSKCILFSSDEPLIHDILSCFEDGVRVVKKALRAHIENNFEHGTIFIVDLDDIGNKLLIREISLLSEAIIFVGSEDDTQLLFDILHRVHINFLFKPCDKRQLAFTIKLTRHLAQCVPANGNEAVSDSHVVGISPACVRIREQAKLLGPSDLPVLITGESGTGKEVVAREFHRLSTRAKQIFMPVNCASLGSLAESELFGHTRGAFTSAIRSTKGFVGSADKGSLFLDEVADLESSVQSSLLRFLDNKEYTKVGESSLRQADVRIISATNKEIETLVLDSVFRADLRFRLAGVSLHIPPLRTRPEDIPLLFDHFLTEVNARLFKLKPRMITDGAMKLLQAYPWPGNVRELKQFVRLAVYKSPTPKITRSVVLAELPMHGEHLPGAYLSYKQAKQKTLRAFDVEYFTNVLRVAGGNLQECLALTGMHKKNYYEKLKALGLSGRTPCR